MLLIILIHQYLKFFLKRSENRESYIFGVFKYQTMRLLNSIKTILALSIILLTIHSCTKDPETVLVEYINTFVITNSSSEAPDNSEDTFSIWANGNVGGQFVKD